MRFYTIPHSPRVKNMRDQYLSDFFAAHFAMSLGSLSGGCPFIPYVGV